MTLQRLKSIDTFRGLCMAWMILGHLTGWWLREEDFWLANSINIILDPIGASGFLFIAGVSLMLSYRKRLLKSINSEEYTYRMIRNEYLLRSFFIFVIALIYNACIAIAINDFKWIWTWFILMTIAISLFMAWPLLKTSKYFRLALGIIIWIVDKLIFDVLVIYEGQSNFFGVLFHILYSEYTLEPILTFFPFLLFGTVVGDVIYDIFNINNLEDRKKTFKNIFIIPSILIGGISILLNVVFIFPEFPVRGTIPWLIYTLGIDLILFSILLTFEIFNIIRTEKSYRLLFYYSYYSLTVYLGHNVLYFLFLGMLNTFNIWFFVAGAFFIIGLILRSVYKKWSGKASLKFQLGKLSLTLARIIESKRYSQKSL